MDEDERRALINALLKVVGIAVAIGAVLGVGIFLMVKVLGLGDAPPPAHTADGRTPSALPTAALSDSSSSTPTARGDASPTTSPTPKKSIQLQAPPTRVGAGQRIDLVGEAPGLDNATLVVQRKEGGTWTPFAGVSARVTAGKFGTYVLTSRTGENKFRVLDPASGKASNVITVRIG